jgi:uncharacterized protein (DUF2249 family)
VALQRAGPLAQARGIGVTADGSSPHMAHLHLQADQLYPFDARGIAKRFRHAAIFGALDALFPGETMRFCNDHDPLPLLAQIEQRYGSAVAISYVQREPGSIVIDFARQDS